MSRARLPARPSTTFHNVRCPFFYQERHSTFESSPCPQRALPSQQASLRLAFTGRQVFTAGLPTPSRRTRSLGQARAPLGPTSEVGCGARGAGRGRPPCTGMRLVRHVVMRDALRAHASCRTASPFRVCTGWLVGGRLVERCESVSKGAKADGPPVGYHLSDESVMLGLIRAKFVLVCIVPILS